MLHALLERVPQAVAGEPAQHGHLCVLSLLSSASRATRSPTLHLLPADLLNTVFTTIALILQLVASPVFVRSFSQVAFQAITLTAAIISALCASSSSLLS